MRTRKGFHKAVSSCSFTNKRQEEDTASRVRPHSLLLCEPPQSAGAQQVCDHASVCLSQHSSGATVTLNRGPGLPWPLRLQPTSQDLCEEHTGPYQEGPRGTAQCRHRSTWTLSTDQHRCVCEEKQGSVPRGTELTACRGGERQTHLGPAQ